MSRSETYQSWKPDYDGQRELTNAGRLEPEAWRTSAQALSDFLAKTYTLNEIERALRDAVADKRFGSTAVHNQRTNIKLYFAVDRLITAYKLRGLPWSQRELDKVLHDFEREPSIQALNVDFKSLMHKMVRNGAFDHLTGLTTTIVSIQYLPGVKQLMERRPKEEAPPAMASEAKKAAARNGTDSPRALAHAGQSTPHAVQQSLKDGAAEPARQVVQAAGGVTPVVNAKIPGPGVSPQSRATQTERAKVPASPITSTNIKLVPLPAGSSSTSKAIIQEGLENLSETDMMPFVHQYELLNDVLRLLERACFFWAEKNVPDVLRRKKWNAWQKVELLDWLDYFSAIDTPLGVPPNTRSMIIETIVPGLKQMRNDAIRRKELPISEVAQMMHHAKGLAKVLHDNACCAILATIAETLSTVQQHSAETRRRLIADFQTNTSNIQKRFMKLMEDEFKAESARASLELEEKLDSFDWNLKFAAPTDEDYAGKTAEKASNGKKSSPPATPATTTAVPERIISVSAGSSAVPASHTRSTSATTAPIPESLHERQASESETVVALATNEQGPPPRGTIEYEAFWTAFRNSSTNLPPISLVKEALDLDVRTWEFLRQDATMIIEEHDLAELRWKDIHVNYPSLIQTFKVLHKNRFKEVKSTAFLDLLCELTFHSARRGILERGRRKQSRQKAAKDEEPVSNVSYDPRIKIREARLAKHQEDAMDVTAATVRDTAARAREARLANLQEQSDRLHALRASASTTPHQSPAEQAPTSSRPRIADYLERDAGLYSPNKRSLSPPGDERQDIQKRVKIEPISQEDFTFVGAGAIPESPDDGPDQAFSAGANYRGQY